MQSLVSLLATGAPVNESFVGVGGHGNVALVFLGPPALQVMLVSAKSQELEGHCCLHRPAWACAGRPLSHVRGCIIERNMQGSGLIVNWHAYAGRCTIQASVMRCWPPGATQPDLEHHFDHLAEGLTPLPNAPKQQVPVLVVLLENLGDCADIASLPDVVELNCLQSVIKPYRGLAGGVISPKRTQMSNSVACRANRRFPFSPFS